MHTLWKTSTIIPIPKKSRPSEPNHYRPVVLTSIIMKCLEKLILKHHTSICQTWILTSLHKRGREYAVACLLQHLETLGNCSRLLLVDFNSTFNTTQCHQMIRKLHHLNVPPLLIHWVHSFLSDRPQSTRVGRTISSPSITDTGSPQGCVLSPFLFILYTNDCTSPSPITYHKFSGDTAVQALLHDNNLVIGLATDVIDYTCVYLSLPLLMANQNLVHLG